MDMRRFALANPEYAQYRNEKWHQYLDGAYTMGILGLCQLPVLISRARRDSLIGHFQVVGFPFNMSEEFMSDHMSFSPRNCEEGRYYSLVTTIFNHADVEHFIGNFKIIGPCGIKIHSAVGRFHTISLFIGAGIAGSLFAWGQYLIQRNNWRSTLPPPKQWLGDSVGNIVESFQHSTMDFVYSSVNSWRPVIGASGAGYGFLAMDACLSYLSLKNKMRQFAEWKRQGNFRNINNPLEFQFLVYSSFLYELSQVVFTGMVISHDVFVFVKDIDPEVRGTLGNIIAYSLDHICHSGHIGGFLFGIAYFFFLKKLNKISGTDRSAFYYLLQSTNRHIL